MSVSLKPGFLSLLTLLFIGLKLTNVIAWSWFWVLSPMILSFVLLGIVLVLLGVVAVLKGR